MLDDELIAVFRKFYDEVEENADFVAMTLSKFDKFAVFFDNKVARKRNVAVNVTNSKQRRMFEILCLPCLL